MSYVISTLEQTEMFVMNLVTLLILSGCAPRCLTGFLFVTTSRNLFLLQ